MGYKQFRTPVKLRVEGAHTFAEYQKQHFGYIYYNNDIPRNGRREDPWLQNS
jgi:predicted secreted acid phosphatase